MAKKIYPGNFVNAISSFQSEGVVTQPGRLFVHRRGYIKVDATPRLEFDVIIPSPDKRPDDKPRADIVGLTVPLGATVTYLGLRILDARKDTGVGSPRSGLIWANAADRIKLASAVSVNGAAITATTLSTAAIDDVSLTAAPQFVVNSSASGVTTTAAMTLKLYYDNGSTAAGNAGGLTSNEPGGSFLTADVVYWINDEPCMPADFGGLPAVVETV